MRARLPALRTLPSSTVATPNSWPMTRRSSVLPLNEKEDVLPDTRSPSIWASALSTSSATPSEKYSWSFPGLMSTKGSTAIDGGVDWGPSTLRSANTASPAPRRMLAATSPPRARRRRAAGTDPAAGGGVTVILPARRSKTHARTLVIGKPAASAQMTARRVQSGRSSPCIIGSTTWSTAKAKTPQPRSARKILRRVSSATSAAIPCGRGSSPPGGRDAGESLRSGPPCSPTVHPPESSEHNRAAIGFTGRPRAIPG
jgi:hypothetical protein